MRACPSDAASKISTGNGGRVTGSDWEGLRGTEGDSTRGVKKLVLAAPQTLPIIYGIAKQKTRGVASGFSCKH